MIIGKETKAQNVGQDKSEARLNQSVQREAGEAVVKASKSIPTFFGDWGRR